MYKKRKSAPVNLSKEICVDVVQTFLAKYQNYQCIFFIKHNALRTSNKSNVREIDVHSFLNLNSPFETMMIPLYLLDISHDTFKLSMFSNSL